MTPNDRYAKIREALEMGPTPGPWDGDDNSVSRLWSEGTVGIREYIALPDSADDSAPNPADMHFIAACDPDTIRELLAERDALAAENERLKEDRARFPDRPDDIHELRIELLRQWLDAHADHCGCADIPWPQSNKCQWPMPAIITDRIHPNEVYLLLLEARGESFGLRLQTPED